MGLGRLENYVWENNKGDLVPLINTTVKMMTDDAVIRKGQRPTCERAGRWPVELGMLQGQNIEWEEVWDTFKIGFATPVDYNTRFRMIIGDLATRSKLGESGGCRLGCGCAEEKHIHIVQCPKLQGLWWKLRGILEALRGRRFVDWDQTVVLGWSYTKKQRSSGRQGGKVEKGSVAMISMLLKIIYIQWVKVATDGTRFDESKVWRIFWGRAKRMWQNVERDSEQQLRNIHQRGSKTHSTWKGINGQLDPLGSIDEDTCCVECNIDWRKHDTF